MIPLVDRAVLQDVPANLLLRRPDVRAAELNVAAQSALVGVAETDFYPALTLLGSIVWSTDSLSGTSRSLDLIGGPSLRWNVFDYGRISNNVRVQDARLQQLIEAYRDKVRQAAREADDAANGLTHALQRERILREAEGAANARWPWPTPCTAKAIRISSGCWMPSVRCSNCRTATCSAEATR